MECSCCLLLNHNLDNGGPGLIFVLVFVVINTCSSCSKSQLSKQKCEVRGRDISISLLGLDGRGYNKVISLLLYYS